MNIDARSIVNAWDKEEVLRLHDQISLNLLYGKSFICCYAILIGENLMLPLLRKMLVCKQHRLNFIINGIACVDLREVGIAKYDVL